VAGVNAGNGAITLSANDQMLNAAFIMLQRKSGKQEH
jgi:hypothetical protein